MREYGPKRIVVECFDRSGKFVRQDRNVMPLSESSLNQMMDHGKTGMIIISASRAQVDDSNPNLSLRAAFDRYAEKQGGYQSIDSDALYDEEQQWLKRRNAAATQQLQKDIKDAGFSYTPVYGGYKPKDGGEATFEPSYIVYCYNRSGDLVKFDYLEQFALAMCKKYKQESVYVQRPGEPPVYLDCDGNQMNSSSSDEFKFNRDQEEYFTTKSRDKSNPQRFTADIVFENLYIPLRPGSYNENMRRRKSGEYIL